MSGGPTARARSAVELAELRVEREKRRSFWSVFVRSVLELHGVTKREAAESAGFRSESILARQLDPEHPDSLALADLAGFDPRVVRDVAQKLARLVGCDLAEMPADLTALGGLKAAARLQREAAEAVLATITALEDGRITRAEAAPLIRELNELVSAALAIRAIAERALVEGVVGAGGDA